MRELLLEIGAEGGSVSLFRISNGKRTRFAISTNDAALEDLLAQEDSTPRGDCGWAGETLAEGLAALDRYRWFRLFPLFVHPDVRETIAAAVAARGGEAAVRRWRERSRL